LRQVEFEVLQAHVRIETETKKQREEVKAQVLFEQKGFCKEGGEGDGERFRRPLQRLKPIFLRQVTNTGLQERTRVAPRLKRGWHIHSCLYGVVADYVYISLRMFSEPCC
jgi:hypothetical protein